MTVTITPSFGSPMSSSAVGHTSSWDKALIPIVTAAFRIDDCPYKPTRVFPACFVLSRTLPEKFPERSPILKLLQSSTLNFEVLTRWAPEKKMHLVDIGSNIISFKHLFNRTVSYQHGLRTFTLDHHLTQAVRDYTAYSLLPSFSLKGF